MVFLSSLAPLCVMGLVSVLTLGSTPDYVIESDTVIVSEQSTDDVKVESNDIRKRGVESNVVDGGSKLEGTGVVDNIPLPNIDLPVIEVNIVNEKKEKINNITVEAPVLGQMGVKGFKTVALGEYKVRAFCGGKCCNQGGDAKGMWNYEGINVAVDPSVIPYGTMLLIDGVGIRQAQPTNQMVSGQEIRVYVSNHSKVAEFGEKLVKIAKVV